MIEQAVERFPVLGPVALLAFGLSLALMVLLRPWLSRYAMARPNARSSHRDPTPQGGGMAVVSATFVVAWGAVAISPALLHNYRNRWGRHRRSGGGLRVGGRHTRSQKCARA